MQKRNRILTIVLLFAVLALSAGCGGGGSGDGGAAVNYSGVTARAVVTDANADDLADATAFGPEVGLGLQDLGTGAVAPRVGVARLVSTATLGLVDEARTAARSAALAVPISEQGTCGGMAEGTVDFLGGSLFDFNANVVFTNFCQDTTTIHGAISVVARMQENGTIRVTEAFTGLSVDDGVDAFQIGGTLTAVSDLVGDSGSITLDLVVENLNAPTLEQVWFEDFVINSVDTVASQIVSIDGRVYHSDHGYVDVTTNAASTLASQYTFDPGVVASIEVLAGDDNPSSGGLLLVGEQATAAIVRVIDTIQYDVVVDGGDWVFDATDTVLGPFNWE